MGQKQKRNPSVVVIGAGMSGILVAIKLREQGITDVTILEKAGNVGGTWRENTYPGVACDVPAHFYTYKFERNPEWSHRYAQGGEIQAYFERVSQKHGVTAKVRFNEEVTEARYERGKWTVKTGSGKTFTADFLVSATGILHKPFVPQFDGLDDYQGAVFHTSQWDHSIDLADKSVGVIGTGSTSSQLVTTLPDMAKKLTVFQRTPQWIFPIMDRNYSETMKQKCRENPKRMSRTAAFFTFTVGGIFSRAVTGGKISHFIMTALSKANLRTVKDKELRAKLTPDYKMGCKRIIMNTSYYKAVQMPNVELETTGIKGFTKTGIEMADGTHHDLDVVVMATGFDPRAFMRPMKLIGKNGKDIGALWDKKVQAYRSVYVPDYPNFFLMLGPNTPIGNFSVIRMSEVQTDYIMAMIERWRDGEFDEVMATVEAQKRFNDYLKKGMGKTVWVTGCDSWYLDEDGDPLSWPYAWKQWVKEHEQPDMADFQTVTYAA
ncbi:MAG: flavin-containing monooxygenase [Maricaulaceae bacterium]